MKLKLMWVKWRDSQIFVNEYHAPEEEADWKVAVFESVGFVVDSNPDRITLSMDFERTGGRYRQLMSIPLENVVSKRLITLETDHAAAKGKKEVVKKGAKKSRH